jgi:hypothetical protein
VDILELMMDLVKAKVELIKQFMRMDFMEVVTNLADVIVVEYLVEVMIVELVEHTVILDLA